MSGTERIAYPDDPLMAIAWRDAVSWAASSPQVLEDYRADTGRSLRIARSPIEQMVDKATGYDKKQLDDFVDWFNEAVWGENPFAASQETT